MKKIAENIIESIGTEIGNIGSFDINKELQLFVEADEDMEGVFYHIELIDIESSDILEASCSDICIDSVSNAIVQMVQNI